MVLLNPKPGTQNPKLYLLIHPKPETRKGRHAQGLYAHGASSRQTPIPKTENRKPKPENRKPKPEESKTENRNPKPETLPFDFHRNPKPETLSFEVPETQKGRHVRGMHAYDAPKPETL